MTTTLNAQDDQRATTGQHGMRINPGLLERPDGQLPEGVYPDGADIPADREHLFSYGRLAYTAPRQVKPYLMFRFLRDTRKKGTLEAAAGLMTDLLGEATMDVLADAKDLGEDEAKQVFRVITRYMEKNANRFMGNS